MSYTLWRGDDKVGYTVGEVSHNPPGTLSANMEMLAAYTLPSGFSQAVSIDTVPRTMDLIIDSPDDMAHREPPVPCPVHAGTDRECFLLREYTGPVEHLTAATAFVLRDPDDRPLDIALLIVRDLRSLFALIAPAHERLIPRFHLSALFAYVLETEAPT